MELGESDRLILEERDKAVGTAEALKKECKDAKRAIEAAKKKRMADFEAYALGEKKDYDASMEQVEMLTQKYEAWMHQLSEAEARVRALNRAKVHESFAVRKLILELMDEYVEDIEVHSEDDIRIIWK